MTTHLGSSRRLTGQQRRTVGQELATRYEKGASIRALAKDIGRSYGFVHRLLTQTGVRLRGRGGGSHARFLGKR